MQTTHVYLRQSARRRLRAGLAAAVAACLVVGVLSATETAAAASPTSAGAYPTTPRQGQGAATSPAKVDAAATEVPGTPTSPAPSLLPTLGAGQRSTSGKTAAASAPQRSSSATQPAVEVPAPDAAHQGHASATAVRERQDLETATSVVYENSDGSFTANVYGRPVNQQNSQQKWTRMAGVTDASTAPTAAAAPGGTSTVTKATYIGNGNVDHSGEGSIFTQYGGGLLGFDNLTAATSPFNNAYVIGASLNLDIKFMGNCNGVNTTIYPITANWDQHTVTTVNRPAYSTNPLGQGVIAGGVNCTSGRRYGTIPLTRTEGVTSWLHGWTPNYGVYVVGTGTAEEFDSGDAYLSITYTAQGAGAQYGESSFAPPWNNKTGYAVVTVLNAGSATWTDAAGYKLGYQLFTQSGTTRTPVTGVTPVLTGLGGKQVTPNNPITLTATLPALTPGPSYVVCWDMQANGQYFSALGVPQRCYALPVYNNPPVIDSLFPDNNATLYSQNPVFTVSAHDPDQYPGGALTYAFQVYDALTNTLLAQRAADASPSWVVPTGNIKWGGVYYWTAQASDGQVASPWTAPDYFTAPSPAQPLVTATLGAAPYDTTVHGVTPSAGNYSAAVTDASIPGGSSGPPVAVTRTYNSLDPRLSTYFGAGWSSVLDMRATPDADSTGNVVVTLADGREERFGLNGDKTFSSPQGLQGQLRAYPATTGTPTGYALVDANHAEYLFTQPTTDPATGLKYYGLTSVGGSGTSGFVTVDWAQQSVTAPDNSTFAATLPTDMHGPGETHPWLRFAWSSSQVTSSTGANTLMPHIATVTYALSPTHAADPDAPTEPWNYSYNGAFNQLTKVCAPTSATKCKTYAYTTGSDLGSHYSTLLLDSNPSNYWPLNDPAGSTAANDRVAVNVQATNATPQNVTFGNTPHLAGSPATTASFNGTSSSVTLPTNLVNGNNLSTGLWFKTATPGASLLAYQDTPAGTAATKATPALYIDSTGHLRGHFADGTTNSLVSGSVVTDNKWHHAVLSGASATQTLFLDDQLVATGTGANINNPGQPVTLVGAGDLVGKPAAPSANPRGWFTGQITDVWYASHPTGLPAVQQEWAAAIYTASGVQTITEPSGQTQASLTYDRTADRITKVTDGGGYAWKIALPSTSGTSAYYDGRVASTRPTYGYEMNEPSGGLASNMLGATKGLGAAYYGTYNNVMLGEPGIFGPSGDTAAGFDSSSKSYMALANGAINADRGSSATVALWFKTTTPGSTLLSYQNTPPGTTATDYWPALYIGTDGKLRGSFDDMAFGGTRGTSGNAAVTTVTTANSVTDGNWHMVTLATDQDNGTTMWLDGKTVGNIFQYNIGGIAYSHHMTYVTAGAGTSDAGFPAANTANPYGYFTGEMSNVMVWITNISRALPDAPTQMYTAKASSTALTPTTIIPVTAPDDTTVTYAFDPGNNNRQIGYTDEENDTTSYSYDARGFIDTVTDPNGHATTYAHDALGDVTEITTCQTTSSCQVAKATYDTSTDPADFSTRKILTSNDARHYIYGSDFITGDYQTDYSYYPTGLLKSVTAPPTAESASGQQQSYTYTDASTPTQDGASGVGLQIATATDTAGRITRYQYYSGGQLARRTDPSGQVTTYGYNQDVYNPPSLTVKSDTYPNGVRTSFTYDAQNRLRSQVEPAFKDAVTGVSHTRRTNLTYDADGNLQEQDVLDTTGGDAKRATIYGYTYDNLVKSVTDPLKRVTTYEYDSRRRVSAVTSPDGQRIEFAYSPRGYRTTTTLKNWTGSPSGTEDPHDLRLETRAYDPAGRLASIIDAMGRGTGYTYWNDNRLAYSQIATGTSSQSATLRYYDNNGNIYQTCSGITPTSSSCPLRTSYTYDALNRITDQTEASLTAQSRTTHYTYGLDNRVATSKVTAAAHPDVSDLTTYTYDTFGNTTQTATQNGSATITSSAAFDQRGLPLSVTSANGNVTYLHANQLGAVDTVTTPPVATQAGIDSTPATAPITTLTGYDTFGDAVEQQDGALNVTSQTYDAAGQLTAVSQQPYLAYGATTAASATTLFTYDAVGRQKTVTDPLTHVTSYDYDQLGDTTGMTDPLGHTTVSSYDVDGELLSMTSPTGARTEQTHDSAGRVATTTSVERTPSAAAYTTTYQYDALSELLSTTQQWNGAVTKYAYNPLQQQTGVTDPTNRTTTTDPDLDGRALLVKGPDGVGSKYTYDQAGRLLQQDDLNAAGTIVRSTSATYDDDGNQLTSTTARNATSQYSYDALDRLTATSQPSAANTTVTNSFGYDADSRKSRVTDPNGNTTYYTYNTLGLPESTIAPSIPGATTAALRATTAQYDLAGRQRTITRPGNVQVVNTFDDAGNLTQQAGTGSAAATQTRAFGYDNDNRLTTTGTGTTSNTFNYDDRGHVVSASGISGNSTMTWDGGGYLTGRTDAAGSTTFTYDLAGRFATQAGPGTGESRINSYNAAGLLETVAFGTSQGSEKYTYDPLNRPATDSLYTSGGTKTASLGYTWDNDDNLASTTRTGINGAASSTYGYDTADRLTSLTEGQTATTYGYDGNGNRTQAGTTTAKYDARNQLKSLTTGGTQTGTFGYSARGTRDSATVGTSTTNYSYDAFDQMRTAGSTGYQYDDLGRLTTVTAGASTQNLSYDGITNQVAADSSQTFSRDASGNVTSYTRGGTRSTALSTTHGEVIAGFNAASGAVSASWSYDPWGQVTGTSQVDLGLQGGWTDPTTKYTNAKSRWIDSSTGSFTSADKSQNAAVPAVHANPFAYADDSPLSNTDLTGHASSCNQYEDDLIAAAKAAAAEAAYQAQKAAWLAMMSGIKGYPHPVMPGGPSSGHPGAPGAQPVPSLNYLTLAAALGYAGIGAAMTAWAKAAQLGGSFLSRLGNGLQNLGGKLSDWINQYAQASQNNNIPVWSGPWGQLALEGGPSRDACGPGNRPSRPAQDNEPTNPNSNPSNGADPTEPLGPTEASAPETDTAIAEANPEATQAVDETNVTTADTGGSSGPGDIGPAQGGDSLDQAFGDLSDMRTFDGVPQVDEPNGLSSTRARLDVDGRSFLGRNGVNGNPDLPGVARPSLTHAEGDVFGQAASEGATGDSADLFVDQPPCGYCNSSFRGFLRGSGIDNVDIYTPDGYLRSYDVESGFYIKPEPW